MEFLGIDTDKYKSIPFWSWNDKLEKDKLIRQIDWMKECGIGGFFMHARSGLRTEYLSEEWMDCIKACAEYAKKIGMDAWAYDENGWPSGYAGGKLLEDIENHDKYLTYTTGEYDADALVSYIVTEDELIRTDKAGEGEYLNIYEHYSTSTADILNPQVVQKFIDLTHKQYKNLYGEKFPEYLKGFFTDEPQYYRWANPYTVMIPEYFRKVYNEDVLDGLGLIFFKKKGYKKFRYQYWKAMQQLMLNAYAKTVYGWCDENGVKLTGHYIEETSLGGQMICCAGIMPFYAYEHIPGIDWLTRNTETPLPAHQVASVAAQTGKKRILCEMYAGCGWDVTPRELKHLTDYLYINGINLSCQHLLPYSEKGNRSHDYPAHYSPVNPWVKERFREFNDYYTKLGAFIAESRENVRIAVLHPIRSAYFNYKHSTEWNDEGFGIKKEDDSFAKLYYGLEKDCVGYHFIDETLLADMGSVRNKKLVCGECEYDILIIPDCVSTMDKSTEKLIRQYAENGGKIYLEGGKPQYLEWEEYSYDYLFSNITYEEILATRPFIVSCNNGKLCTSFRKFNGEDYAVILNHTLEENCKANIRLPEGFNSWKAYNADNDDIKYYGEDIELLPGELLIITPDRTCCERVKDYEIVEVKPQYKVISSEENSMTLDEISYSADGISYGEKMAVPMAFNRLLRERYKGKLYIKYSFEIEKMPESLRFEIDTEGFESVTVNGNSVDFNITRDILQFVKIGNNDIVVSLDYKQSENVYYVYFGENITESLKNCLVYDTELEPVILKGNFAVYAKDGFTDGDRQGIYCAEKFVIGEKGETVTSLVKDGYTFFAGKIRLATEIECVKKDVLLKIKGRWHIAGVWVNGKRIKDLIFTEFIDVSDYVTEGKNSIELEFTVGNRNLYGPHHYAEDNEPMMVGPDMFEFSEAAKQGFSDKFQNAMSFVETL